MNDTSSPGFPGQVSTSFDLLDEQVRRWIWNQEWPDLRDIQEAAIRSVLERRSDLIIAAATASGKTEAAFLPVCSALVAGEHKLGIRALYVGPLKALINDQFRRIEDLCEGLQIPVHRWHGDVPAGRKRQLVARPSGVLLITPESLEALFVVHGHRMTKLFSGLDWVVIDEIHAFVGSDRGRQLQSLLHRLELALDRRVPRIGLSATLGDMSLGAAYLRPDNAAAVETIVSKAAGQEIRLQIRGYVARQGETSATLAPDRETSEPSEFARIADHLFLTLRGADHLVFANSRRDVEALADLLRRRSDIARLPNEFFPHHGNLARELREDLEKRLKDPAMPATAVCTSTLELGIDIGQVASVGQIGAPYSVSSLRQRLGRSGRRGEAATLRLYIREPEITPRSHLLDRLRTELVQAVAMVELLIERWCEPPTAHALHLSPLVQQVLSLIAEHGGLSAQEAWKALCRSGPFHAVGASRFARLLRAMGARDLLTQSNDGTLLFGRKGERIANHFSFFTIFPTPEEFQVLHSGRLLGTLSVDYLLAEGLHIIFAGRRWRVVSVDPEQKVVLVEASPGGRVPTFVGSSGGLIHDRVRTRMREVWEGRACPRYLDRDARRLLEEGRSHYARLNLEAEHLVPNGKGTILFLCRGDTICHTLGLQLLAQGLEVSVEGPAILIDDAAPSDVREVLVELVREGIAEAELLAKKAGNKRSGKYDWVLDEQLLEADYASRALDTKGAHLALRQVIEKPATQSRGRPMGSRDPQLVPDLETSAEDKQSARGRTATALAEHLACRHLTTSNRAAELGEIEPPPWGSPVLAAIRARGAEHEKSYLDHLRAEGIAIHELFADDADPRPGTERTIEAMRAGAQAIVQAPLAAKGWRGVADVLLRVDEPSNLGTWSYEAVDTKLARETRGGTILQLCLYSELIAAVQGRLPTSMHVVSPGRDFARESHRVREYIAYYRWVKKRYDNFLRAGEEGRGEETYPHPTTHCEICRWRPVCESRRRRDDHLSLVAGISKLQMKELNAKGIERLADLARLPVPIGWKPSHGSIEAYGRLRDQARVQLEERDQGRPVYELLARAPDRGLARLPRPSAVDVFFDIEGDPFAGEGGREYLFGYAARNGKGDVSYQCRWALDAADERAMFEHFVAEVMARWDADPEFHIYHYAAYEPATLKRLMGRYAVCEDEIDRMLRAGLFVDLHAIVRQSILAGVESYSIKQLEPLVGFEREQNLREVRAHLSAVERALEVEDAASLPHDVLEAIEAYNRDDCMAAAALRAWLEDRRSELVEAGETLERPAIGDGDPTEDLAAHRLDLQRLQMRLRHDVPVNREIWNDEQRARWQLAHLLEWHRRELKVTYWEYVDLKASEPDQLIDRKEGVGAMQFEGVAGGTQRCPIHEYSFAPQDVSIKANASLHHGDVKVGTLDALDQVGRRICIKRTQASADTHPSAVFAHDMVSTRMLEGALGRFGTWVGTYGLDADGPYRAARDLLMAASPRLISGAVALRRRQGEEPVDWARRLALDLDRGILPVQGPPGSGKTYLGARMICALVAAGKKVGITANSHKVIRNLLKEVVRAARKDHFAVSCVVKVKELSENATEEITEVKSNADVLAELEAGGAQVAAGTAWLWTREELFESVDVLFVDEAGQLSLANALAVAQAGHSLVLLGDPQQLEQPQKGSHPEGTDTSALDHLLGDRRTLSENQGMFLPDTWRLHPSVCAFTSEVFYDRRLVPRPELQRQSIDGAPPFDGPGLWFVPVIHEGNQSACQEEIEPVARIVARLTAPGSSWTDSDGQRKPLRLDDILIVAPYNAQVALISERLGSEARVGTVDKFQGQQAAVVIYSMTTSTPEEAPRGMTFLYSANRLNVATSRARCACILVASPRLFEPECHSPRQMKLANAFCRYLEMATVVPGESFSRP